MILTIGGIIIPIIAMIILYNFFREETALWEYFVPLAASLIITIIAKTAFGWGIASDTEYWTNYITKIVYVEDWNELVHYTTTSTDADGNVTIQHHTRVDYHPEYYVLIDNQNSEKFISKTEYKHIRDTWGKEHEKFENLRRSYHTDDGDKYYVIYPINKRMFTVTSKHLYQNKVAANSDSILKFEEINEDEWNLFEYPKKVGIDTPSIMSEISHTKDEIHNLNVFNAMWGSRKKIRVWYLVWSGEESLSTAYAQQNYWQNGNKNELIVCIGVNKDKEVKWSHVFSWSDREDLKIQFRDRINENKGQVLELDQYTSWMENHIGMWEKKDFDDFNYLTVPLPMWTHIIIYILSGLISYGMIYIVVNNEANAGGATRHYWKYGRKFKY